MSKLCLFGRNKQEKYVVCEHCTKEECMISHLIQTTKDETPDIAVLFDILIDHSFPEAQEEELKKAMLFILKRKFKG